MHYFCSKKTKILFIFFKLYHKIIRNLKDIFQLYTNFLSRNQFDGSILWSKGYGISASINGGDFHVLANTESQKFSRYKINTKTENIIWFKLTSKFTNHHSLHKFWAEYSHRLNKKFVIITSDGDLNVPRDLPDELVRKILNHPNLEHWYTQNLTSTEYKAISPIPIGLDLHSNKGLKELNYLKDTLKEYFDYDFHKRRTMVYCDCLLNPTSPDRVYIKKILPKSSIYYVPEHRTSFRDLLEQYSLTKFVLSPFGAGLDCHRTWEAIYCGAMPIVHEDVIIPSIFSDFVIQIPNWERLRDPTFQLELAQLTRPKISADEFESLVSEFLQSITLR